MQKKINFDSFKLKSNKLTINQAIYLSPIYLYCQANKLHFRK